MCCVCGSDPHRVCEPFINAFLSICISRTFLKTINRNLDVATIASFETELSSPCHADMMSQNPPRFVRQLILNPK